MIHFMKTFTFYLLTCPFSAFWAAWRAGAEREGGREGERRGESAPQNENDDIEEEKRDPGAERGPLDAAPLYYKEQQRKGLQDMRERIPQGGPRSKAKEAHT